MNINKSTKINRESPIPQANAFNDTAAIPKLEYNPTLNRSYLNGMFCIPDHKRIHPETDFLEWLYGILRNHQHCLRPADSNYFMDLDISLYSKLIENIEGVSKTNDNGEAKSDDFSNTVQRYGISMDKSFIKSIEDSQKNEIRYLYDGRDPGFGYKPFEEYKLEYHEYYAEDVYKAFAENIIYLIEKEISDILVAKEKFSSNDELCGQINEWVGYINCYSDKKDVCSRPNILQRLILQRDSRMHEFLQAAELGIARYKDEFLM